MQKRLSRVRGWFSFRLPSFGRVIAALFLSALMAFFAERFVVGGTALTGVVWGLVLLAALLCPVGLSEKAPLGVQLALLVLVSFGAFALMEYTIGCQPGFMALWKFFANGVFLAGIASAVWFFSRSLRASLLTATVLSAVIAAVDHIVVLSRGFEIQFSDIFSAFTAMSVAANYEFDLWRETRKGLLGFVCLAALIAVMLLPRTKKARSHRLLSAALPVLTVLISASLFIPSLPGAVGISKEFWKFKGSQANGFFLNFLSSAASLRVQEPEGYDADALAQYDADVTDAETTEKKPHIIVVMNESFTDVQTIAASLGTPMETTTPVTPFYDSLSDADAGLIKGHALASVYGGNTANSEFEFLTGHSMAFLPQNSVPYTLFLNADNTFGLTSLLRSLGYSTAALHPDNPVNWQRSTVYPQMGFDETYFVHDFPNRWYRRNHVTDAAVYDRLIEVFEDRAEGESLFLFTVTMQNHGGFETGDIDLTAQITDGSDAYKADEYLSSVQDSDREIARLVSYFNEQDEDVILLFFGDHQPSIELFSEKYYGYDPAAEAKDRLGQYVVPYFFWTNGTFAVEDAAPVLTSFNYLAPTLLDLAGLPKTAFFSHLSALQDEIPAINAFGYMDKDLTFHPIAYAEVTESGAVNTYAHLSYNALFDDEKRLKRFFTVAAK